jgi:hypothetical protein
MSRCRPRQTRCSRHSLYFPGEPRNATDNIYSAELLMAVIDAGAVREAAFNFVLRG